MGATVLVKRSAAIAADVEIKWRERVPLEPEQARRFLLERESAQGGLP